MCFPPCPSCGMLCHNESLDLEWFNDSNYVIDWFLFFTRDDLQMLITIFLNGRCLKIRVDGDFAAWWLEAFQTMDLNLQLVYSGNFLHGLQPSCKYRMGLSLLG